ncbi:hypothetical protein D3C81_1652990 [compost metagenome]
MADDLQAFLILGRDDLQADIVVDDLASIDQTPVELAGNGAASKARANGSCDVQDGDRAVEVTLRPIGQGHGKGGGWGVFWHLFRLEVQ